MEYTKRDERERLIDEMIENDVRLDPLGYVGRLGKRRQGKRPDTKES